MISDRSEWDAFLTDHRWGVLTTLRASGSAVSSVVAYARDGDALVISTPGATFKRRSLERDPRATLCVITNSEPFNFVSVEGHITIETDDLVRSTRRVFQNIAGTGYEEPADLPGWLAAQSRVILRLIPERVYGVIR
ncbi:MAG: TIGR03618 family F420-dependent PPOX class oxidoreductase [Pseudomonadales bacterium]